MNQMGRTNIVVSIDMAAPMFSKFKTKDGSEKKRVSFSKKLRPKVFFDLTQVPEDVKERYIENLIESVEIEGLIRAALNYFEENIEELTLNNV